MFPVWKALADCLWRVSFDLVRPVLAGGCSCPSQAASQAVPGRGPAHLQPALPAATLRRTPHLHLKILPPFLLLIIAPLGLNTAPGGQREIYSSLSPPNRYYREESQGRLGGGCLQPFSRKASCSGMKAMLLKSCS